MPAGARAPWRLVAAGWCAGSVLSLVAAPTLAPWAAVAWALLLALAALALRWSTWASVRARIGISLGAAAAWFLVALWTLLRDPPVGLGYTAGLAGLLWAIGTQKAAPPGPGG